MNVILFPTDFSDCANEAKKVAFSLAKLFEAELRVVHVVSDTIFNWESEIHFSKAVDSFPLLPNIPKVVTGKKNSNRFLEAIENIKEEANKHGVKASVELLFGNASAKIIEESTKCKASLIVMGTNGASGFNEAFIGSVAQKITRHAKCPVLSLRKVREEGFKVEKLIYASDFSVESENNNLQVVKVLANYFNARIHLLYINSPHYFEETIDSVTRITKVAEEHELSNFQIEIYNHFTVEDGVLAYANSNDIDLIAVSNHQYGLLKSIVEYKTVEVLVNHADVPVLTLNI